MTYKQPFLRLVVQGQIYAAETFSWSIAFGTGISVAPPPPTTMPVGIISAITTFHAGSGMVSKYAKLDRIKLNQIGIDGRYTQDVTLEHEFNPVIEGASTLIVPPQVALAFTLDTSVRRGRASHGRFYLPMPGIAAEPATGALAASTTNAYATQARTMLNAIVVALGLPYRPVVTSKLGLGEERNVTGIRVGRVLDTIRSRRTSLPEDYATSPFP